MSGNIEQKSQTEHRTSHHDRRRLIRFAVVTYDWVQRQRRRRLEQTQTSMRMLPATSYQKFNVLNRVFSLSVILSRRRRLRCRLRCLSLYIFSLPTRSTISVTRFDRISTLWQNFISLWPFFDGLLSNKQNFEPTLSNFVCSWANLHCCKFPNTEQIIKPSGHTVHDTHTDDIPKIPLLWSTRFALSFYFFFANVKHISPCLSLSLSLSLTHSRKQIIPSQPYRSEFAVVRMGTTKEQIIV